MGLHSSGGAGLWRALLCALFLPAIAFAQANSWSTNSAGKWETNSNWSLGVAPTNTQSGTFITNALSKTVTIDSITSGSFPGTLTISNLTVSAPSAPASANTLLLNNSGLGTPLRVLNSLSISANATLLVQTNSIVQVDTLGTGLLSVNGLVSLVDGALFATNPAAFFHTGIGHTGRGQLTMTNATFRVNTLAVGFMSGSTGTLTIQGNLAEVRGSDLFVAANAGTTGTVWMLGGQLVATNTLTTIGNLGGSGRMIVSNGTVNAGTVTIAAGAGSAGTLSVAGGTFNAERLVATSSAARIEFLTGTMTLRGADIANSSAFAIGLTGLSVLNLPAGTNRFGFDFTTAFTEQGSNLVWITGADLVVTNGTSRIGDTGFGQITLSNGSWRARDVYLSRVTGSRGILAVAGGTNLITSELRIGSDVGSSGSVAVTGGQLVVTNNVTSVGYLGSGDMTVFTNGKFQMTGLIIGFNAGSRGTFTLAGATLDLRAGFSVGELASATGAVWLTTGSLTVTNGGLESVVGTSGTGQMAVSNALFRTTDFRVGRNAGSRGTLTIAGGTNLFDSFLSIAPLANATGTVWITGGRVVVTNNVISFGAGIARMTISNGVVLTKEINIIPGASGRGTLTIDGGTVTAANLIISNSTGTVLFEAGRLILTNSTSVANGQSFVVGNAPFTGPEGPGTAILNLSGVNHDFTGGMIVGFSATGEVWVTGTQLTVTNFLTVAGGGRTGLLTLSNATAIVGGMAVASLGATVGTLTSVNSTIRLSSFLELGTYDDFGGDRGTIWINGGQLVVTNDVTRVGNRGDGTLVVSNGTVLLKDLQVSSNATAHGTVTLAGGTTQVFGPVAVGVLAGATGTVWLTGGQLTATNGTNFVAYSGVGRMTVSNGTWRARHVIVGFAPFPNGVLNLAGGTNVFSDFLNIASVSGGTGAVVVAAGVSSVYSNVTVGNFPCGGSGASLSVTGGEFRVTNTTGNAVLEVRAGTLTQSGGTLQINRLVLTNFCARFIHTGGTLLTNVVTLSTNLFFDADGDGIDNKWEQENGFDPFSPADAALDTDGDGQSNLEEFTMGTNPRDANSFLRIISVVRTNNDIRVTWTVAPKSGNGLFLSYDVQFGTNLLTGVTNFLGQINIGPGFAGTTTNFLDTGGATNQPARFYRIHGFID